MNKQEQLEVNYKKNMVSHAESLKLALEGSIDNKETLEQEIAIRKKMIVLEVESIELYKKSIKLAEEIINEV
jgi:hypothetical protein